MATLLLSSVASAATSSLTGFSGALIQVGATVAANAVGGIIDNALFGGGSTTQRIEGPRLQSLDVMTSREGAGMPDPDGRLRIGGQVIWATRLEEVTVVNRQTTGGGKGLGGSPSQTVETTEFIYLANFAVGICEGPVSHFGRVWADGKPLDLSGLEVRFYYGTETQAPDPLIVAKDGAAPAYRGCAYVVFEGLDLGPFGNRIPQLSFEVFGRRGDLEGLVKGVDIIPGSTEFGYHPEVVRQVSYGSKGEIVWEAPENAHRHRTVSDWSLSMDTLQGTLPAVGTAALVVAWFGTDLRAGLCEVEPRVEIATKQTDPVSWSVAGLTRSTANVVSEVEPGKPAFGSTPDDASVIAAIKDLRARGLRVVLYPFMLMDIPAGANLPHPSGTGTQGVYPWRGRIEPRAGEGVAAEVSAFAGTASAADFTVSGETVSYSGPAEWKFRRMTLHLAALAKAAGGVDAFLVGSEMVGMTSATAPGSGVYPFVDVLADLAAEVKTLLPSALVSYAADWSEYHSHRPADGSGDVFFNLDPFWSSPSVDFIGIDNYLPLSDWRPGVNHADYDPAKGWTSVYSLDYLKANIEGGEWFDWFYASEADRVAQVRTPITDGAYGEPWIFRNKAIRDWHGNAHHNRPAGVRDATPTAWTPGSKPVWFTEVGCPAIDLGSNRPNAFVTQFSGESALPWFSAGVRDDFIARQYLRALLEWWAENGAGVVSTADVMVWAWDARPWPEFPILRGTWTDGPDWNRGHWWNGRAGAAPAAEAIRRRLVEKHGVALADIDVAQCYGQADGYAPAGPVSFRDYVQPWESVLRIDASEEGGRLAFRSRAAATPTAPVTPDDMVDEPEAPRFSSVRGRLEDVARQAILRFKDGLKDYDQGAARASIEVGPEAGIAEAETPLVLDLDRAAAGAELMLRTSAQGRDRLSFALPPSRDDVRPGRLVQVEVKEGRQRVYIVDRVTLGDRLGVEASSYDPAAFAPAGGLTRAAPRAVTLGASRVTAVFLDLPLLLDQQADDWKGWLAAHAQPWPGGADFYRSPEEDTGFVLNTRLGVRAMIGETVAPLDPGRLWTWSGEALDVRLYSGSLVTRPEADVLAGANALAVEHAPGEWEVLQFRRAALIGSSTWRCSALLRGQRGTEGARGTVPLPAGARVVGLDLSVRPAEMTASDIGRAYWWRFGPATEDQAGDLFSSAQVTFRGIGRRPFAPVYLTASPAGGGDLAFTWTRRTRIEGDGWTEGAGDVPLGEVAESYRIEVGPAGAPWRVVTVSTPAWTYTAADQTADGASPPYEVRVAQISETFGPGVPAALTVAS